MLLNYTVDTVEGFRVFAGFTISVSESVRALMYFTPHKTKLTSFVFFDRGLRPTVGLRKPSTGAAHQERVLGF